MTTPIMWKIGINFALTCGIKGGIICYPALFILKGIRIVRLLSLITLALVSLPSLVMSADLPVTLSLSDAIRMAAEKNLDVRAELYNPAQFEADINRNRAIYDPLFNAQLNYSDSTTPGLSTTGSASSFGQTYQINPSLSQLFWTGATATLNFNNQYNSNRSLNSLQKGWQSNLGITLNQPLLKNFGQENTEINITVSRLSKFASLEHFNTQLLNTIAQVRSEYFKLYNLREQLEVRKVSLELARKILSETRARVTAGILPAMEILNAEFGVTSREKELIDAEKAVRDQIDVLRLLLQIDSKGDIVTTNLPRRDQMQMNEDEAIKRALTRPDIREQRRNLEIAELKTRVFSNNIKPDLSLLTSASLTGNDHSYSKTLDKLGSLDFPAWSVGLNFTYPFGNNAAENDYRKSRLKTEQTVVQIRSLEESAAKDVKAAIRGVSTGYKQLDVADRGRAYAEERLKAFIRKNAVGLATVKDVMDVENDLATAKSNQITAAVNYDNAITTLWQVTGELLERVGVHIVEADADRLYNNVR
jgi:outer membrane protein